MEQNLHTLTVTERKRINISGVSEVDSVTPEKIKITLTNGTAVIILGERLKMGAFSNQTGALSLDGKINEIKYLAEKGNLIKKLLK